MRKETVIKFEKEFIAWCKGESVLKGSPMSICNRDLYWEEVKDFADWKALDTVYVLNDSYSTYRKALIDGKTIQFYDVVEQHETNPSLDVYGWRDFKSFKPNSSFTFPIDKYRIKEDIINEDT